MSNTRTRRTVGRNDVVTNLIVLLVWAPALAGCTGSSYTAPSPLPRSSAAAPAVTSISPTSGPTWRGSLVTITGAGFQRGAIVTFDTASAAGAFVVSSDRISATPPTSPAGTVNVVVTNPDGQRATLTAGHTFEFVPFPTLTPSVTSVAAGGPLSVSWNSALTGKSDWIGLFKISDRNQDYLGRWSYFTEGKASGTATLVAPTEPGQYEFRYLLDDDFVEAARSSVVTVR